MQIVPKIIGGVCLTAHPEGLKKALESQIDYVKNQKTIDMPKRVLVIGGSGGFGLATRIAAAFAGGAGTLNVSFEREPTAKKPASPGWYINKYFDQSARGAGLKAESLNADAFSHDTRKEVIEKIKDMFGQIDLLVYSIASPVRVDPDTGEQYKSVLKPLGKTYAAKAVNFQTGDINEVSIEPGTETERQTTVKVMGGEDWILWVKALKEAGVLADGAKTVAYSYIGPEVTFGIYRSGTIGSAKEHLEASAKTADSLFSDINGQAFVSVNKGLVTRASAVIPVIPLYMSLLFKTMKDKGIHEGCIEQMYRMLSAKIYGADGVIRDENGLVRMDDWEMRADVQKEVSAQWDKVTSENLEELTDIAGFRRDFLQLHGFEWDGVDYSQDVDTQG